MERLSKLQLLSIYGGSPNDLKASSPYMPDSSQAILTSIYQKKPPSMPNDNTSLLDYTIPFINDVDTKGFDLNLKPSDLELPGENVDVLLSDSILSETFQILQEADNFLKSNKSFMGIFDEYSATVGGIQERVRHLITEEDIVEITKKMKLRKIMEYKQSLDIVKYKSLMTNSGFQTALLANASKEFIFSLFQNIRDHFDFLLIQTNEPQELFDIFSDFHNNLSDFAWLALEARLSTLRRSASAELTNLSAKYSAAKFKNPAYQSAFHKKNLSLLPFFLKPIYDYLADQLELSFSSQAAASESEDDIAISTWLSWIEQQESFASTVFTTYKADMTLYIHTSFPASPSQALKHSCYSSSQTLNSENGLYK